MPIELSRRVADYLDSGVYAGGYRGYSQCRICMKLNGSRELTDGTWVWPEGLSHYVRDHSVTLPQLIIEKACGSEWRACLSANKDYEGTERTSEFWLEWCATNSSGVMRPFLEAGMTEAEASANKVIAKTAAEKEAQFGVCTIQCGKQSCTRMSMNKHCYCGLCDTEQYRDSLTGRCYLVWPAIDAYCNSSYGQATQLADVPSKIDGMNSPM